MGSTFVRSGCRCRPSQPFDVVSRAPCRGDHHGSFGYPGHDLPPKQAGLQKTTSQINLFLYQISPARQDATWIPVVRRVANRRSPWNFCLVTFWAQHQSGS